MNRIVVNKRALSVHFRTVYCTHACLMCRHSMKPKVPALPESVGNTKPVPRLSLVRRRTHLGSVLFNKQQQKAR